MKCTEFEKLVNEYVDGELTHSLMEIEEHLKTCTECQALYEETLELKALLNDLEPVELPDDFEITLHERLLEVQEEKKVIPFYQRFKGMKVVASVAALVMVSFVAFRAGMMVPPTESNGMNEAVYSANMAMDDDANMAEAVMEESEMDMEMADEESVATSFSEPMAKGLRVSEDAFGFAKETEQYFVSGTENYDAVLALIGSFKVEELMTYEDISFYITEEDFLNFNQSMNRNFIINDQLILEVHGGIEEMELSLDYQKTYIDELKTELEAEDNENADLKDSIIIEEEVLAYMEEELELMKKYESYRFVVIRFDEE